MTKSDYKLKFMPEALDEWNRLDGSVREVFRKALKKCLANPHMPGSELHRNFGVFDKRENLAAICGIKDKMIVILQYLGE